MMNKIFQNGIFKTGLLALSVGTLVVIVVLFWIIYSPVREVSTAAQIQFGGDRLEALLRYIESDEHSLKEKNHTVWAIGQFGDERAIPILKKFWTVNLASDLAELTNIFVNTD